MGLKPDDGMPDAYEVVEAVEATARKVLDQPIVNRGLSVLGMLAVALVAAPLLIVLTLVWGLVAGLVIGVFLPPGEGGTSDPSGFATALTLILTFGPPLVALFLVLRWGLVHLPPNVRRYFTS